jgi:hypothetical protein
MMKEKTIMNESKNKQDTQDETRLSRRDFVKQASAASAVYWVPPTVGSLAEPAIERLAVVSAMGDALIPSAPGDPGYKDLEAHGISQEVLKGLQGLSDDLLGALNQSSQDLFDGKKMVDLDEKERESYLKAIISGKSFADKGTLFKLQTTYKMLRLRILTVYYQNFPENVVPKDSRGVPTTSDPHQISNPNTQELVTGWDVANYPGPVTWEEEERLRARMKNIFWEGD